MLGSEDLRDKVRLPFTYQLFLLRDFVLSSSLLFSCFSDECVWGTFCGVLGEGYVIACMLVIVLEVEKFYCSLHNNMRCRGTLYSI